MSNVRGASGHRFAGDRREIGERETRPMPTSGPSSNLLSRLAPDQRAAATAPPGPVLCIAPAGSGKTTTLVARVAWLIDGGADPGSITVIAFNRRAAEELSGRLDAVLGPERRPSGTVRVRTFHALGREILREAGHAVEPLVDRGSLLARLRPAWSAAERRRLDTAISRLKLDLRADPKAVARDPEAGPIARAFVDYDRAVGQTGGLDFDDLIARALLLLEDDADLRASWRARSAHLLVDEAQDLDRSQLDLALLLAAPGNNIFLVGDDDQSIYGWRLADVRRVLSLASALPGLRRVDLTVNYRCPAPVIDRAVRLVEHNAERFGKTVRPGPTASGRLLLAPSPADPRRRTHALLDRWGSDDAEGTLAILARTNRELEPAAVACVAAGQPFRSSGLRLIVESPIVDQVLECASERTDPTQPLLLRIGRVQAMTASPGEAVDGDGRDDDQLTESEVAQTILGWAAGYPDLQSLTASVAAFRARLAELAAGDARLTLATAHGTKGLEFDHVAVLSMDATSFPNAKAIIDANEPERALEEERRLAYVAWTRARRSLTLAYDPDAPSPFMLEAFDPAELGLDYDGVR